MASERTAYGSERKSSYPHPHLHPQRGIGLWTSICLAFANVFGRPCERYNKKVRSVTYLIKGELERQMSAHPDYDFGDIRLTSDKPLSFTGSVTGKYREKQKNAGK